MGRPKGSKNKSPIPLEQRFWEKVDKRGKAECWEWQAYIHPSGYGNVAWNGRMWGVHQISWLLHNGDIPDGLCVLHRCDNRICVNPNHLFLGTYKDNAIDRDSKNRGAIPDNRGENHGMSKLTKGGVIRMRDLWGAGIYNQQELGEMFKINRATVSLIVNRKSWAWLE